MRTDTPLYPLPRVWEPGTGEPVRLTGITCSGDEHTHATELVSELELHPGRDSLQVHCVRSSDEALIRDPVTGARHNEGYRIVADDNAGARLEYASRRGLRYGLTALAQLLQTGSVRAGMLIEDAPRFPIRGVIEGYYGPPWSPKARRGVLKLMARARMNAYFYGPKDDEFHRARWSEPYPNAKFAELREAVELTRALDMDFWYTIGPGLSMSYAREEDVAALLDKLRQVAGLGVTRFGLLFDDIPARLQHQADLDRFSSLPEAHAVVANRIYRELREEVSELRFAVCPTQYHGNGTEGYITQLGTLLDPRLEVFWTGPEICSRELTLRDAAQLERTISRPILYWDNYPVNDAEMTNELHIGPYRGRDPHLYRASTGIVANGMEYAEGSKIGFLTIADYLWNPEAYDPEESWDRALRAVVGDRDWEAFRIFADNTRYSALYPTDSPYLSSQLERAQFLRATRREPEARKLLRETVGQLERAVVLFDHGLENKALESEIGRWIAKYRMGVELLKAVLSEEGGQTGTSLQDRRREYDADRTYVFADVLNWIGE
jgi:hyaluronoglucosaminidase